MAPITQWVVVKGNLSSAKDGMSKGLQACGFVTHNHPVFITLLVMGKGEIQVRMRLRFTDGYHGYKVSLSRLQ